MAEEKHQDDPELARLQAKTAKGALNVIEAILNEPKFQAFLNNPKLHKLINKLFIKQSLKMGLIMGFLVTGLLMICNNLKQILNVNDGIFGFMLTMIGLLLLIKEVKS